MNDYANLAKAAADVNAALEDYCHAWGQGLPDSKARARGDLNAAYRRLYDIDSGTALGAERVSALPEEEK